MDLSEQYHTYMLYEMRLELHLEQSVSTIVCLKRICQDSISDVNITSHYTLEINDDI